MKGMGGVTSSVNREDDSSLARWGLCIHEMASIIDEYEEEENEASSSTDIHRHHEDTLVISISKSLFEGCNLS